MKNMMPDTFMHGMIGNLEQGLNDLAKKVFT
jgi:hypothetical protein